MAFPHRSASPCSWSVSKRAAPVAEFIAVPFYRPARVPSSVCRSPIYSASKRRVPSTGAAQVGRAAVAVGRAEPARHVRPEAERPARIPRAVRHHSDEDHRRPLLRTLPATGEAHRQARGHPLAHNAVERPRRRRHHRPDRQRRGRHRPRRQAAAGLAAAGARLRRRKGTGEQAKRHDASAYTPSSSSAASCTRGRRRSSARAAARSARPTIRSAWSTTPRPARRSPRCNCRRT